MMATRRSLPSSALPEPKGTADEGYMDRALSEAEDALDHGCAGVGALLAWRGEVLALDHNTSSETGDLTAHAEMTVLRAAASRLSAMSDADKADLTIYCTLEPCLMCLAALSFVGVHRVVYAALNDDANDEAWIARGITTELINPRLKRGALELVPGVRRDQGIALLQRQGIAREETPRTDAS